MNTKTVFRSRIGVLLLVFVMGVLLPPLLSDSAPVTGLYVLGGILLFILFIFTGVRYVVSEGKLVFRLWFIPLGSIGIREIRSVERSYNPLSSPAVSLKRLRLTLWDRTKSPFVLISPVREREFIEALKAVNPDIRVAVTEKRGWWRIWDWDI